MDITAIGGKLNLSTIRHSKSLTAYIARPDAKIIARIRGITKMDIKAKYVDISEVSFEVSKYSMDISSYKFALNPTYDALHAFCCILIPELGQYGLFRIEEEPDIVAKNIIDEKKVFTAYTYESILQYENLVRFDINQGTDTSLEMYSDNLNSAGMPMNKIQLYNPQEPRLSLLNLALTDDYYGWSVGHVDESIRSKVRAFSIDNQNLYSFFVEDCQKAFRCIFDFDTINKRINVYDAETVGNNTNIYLSFQSFVKQMNVSQTNESVYTVFNVAGDNGLDISRVNFGSNKIVNISYPLSLLDSDIRNAYSQYADFRESKRDEYINAYKQYTILLGEKNSILDRQPQDVINNNWSSTVYYTLEELRTDLTIYQSIVDSILLLYTKQDGTIDYDALNISPDASLYYSYHDVVIPDITAEIAARESGEGDNAETVDADVVWELYGLNDLEVKLKSYKNIVSSLAEQGYDQVWDTNSNSISKDTWDAHHDEYIEYSGYIRDLTAIINSRKEALEDINNDIDSCLSDIASITSLVKIENYFARFPNGDSYVATIKSLYKESDYEDTNYLITDFDDVVSVISESELLLEAAEERLEIESRPQLTWSIDSDNLFAIPELSEFRSHIQNGDFCTVVYGGDTTNYSPMRKSTLDVSQGRLRVDGGDLMLSVYNNGSNSRNRSYNTSFKMRIVEIDFNGLNIGDSFSLTFSDVIATTSDVSDVENLIGSFVSSRTNSIQAATLSTASNTAKNIASSVIRPYIEAMRMQVANLESSQIYADDVEALRIKVDTLIADYIEANKASIFDLKAGSITADKSITLVSRSGYGSIEMSNAAMDFKDASGNTRVHIGKSGSGNYSVDIYSAADTSGQKLLWSSSGITIDAIADGMITNAKLSEVSADKVTVGTLTSKDGSSYWNLDTGELSLNGYVINAKVEYALGDSPTIAPQSGWSTSSPTWTTGKYVWQKTTLTKTGSDPVVTTTCIQGATGESAYSYDILLSSDKIIRDSDDTLSPNAITFTAKIGQGTNSPQNYSGRFVIETTIDGDIWTTSYTSSINEASKVFTVPTTAKIVRCTLYAAGGTTTPLVVRTVPVIKDGANAKELVLLTPDGDTFTDGFGSIDIVGKMFDGGMDVSSSVQSWGWDVYTGGQYVPVADATSSYITVNGSDIITSRTYRCIAVYSGATYAQYKTITNIRPSDAITLTTETYDSGDSETTIYAKLLASGDDITNTYPESFYTWFAVTESGSTFLGHGYSVVVDDNTFEYGGVVRLVFSGTEIMKDSVVRFINNSDETSIPHIVVGINPQQDISGGAPSQSNVCPIYGYSDIVIGRTGKNIVYRFNDTTYVSGGLTYTPSGDGVLISGTSTSESSYMYTYRNINGINAKPFCGKKLIASIICESSDVALYCGYNDSDGVYHDITSTNSAIGDVKFVLPYSAVTFCFKLKVSSGVTLDNVNVKVMLRLESDVDSNEYETYNGLTKVIDISQVSEVGQIYGGYFDLTNGTLTVTHDCILLYGGEPVGENWISSMDVYSAGATPTLGAQVVYKLPTPITYKLDENNITALNGINYVWCDTCDITVDYYTDGEQALIYGTSAHGYLLDNSKVVASQNDETRIAVYEISPNMTYYVTWLADANAYKVAFGDKSADELINNLDVVGYEDCSESSHTNYAVTNTNNKYLYVYYTTNNGDLNENYVRVTRDVPLYTNIDNGEDGDSSSGFGVATISQIQDFLNI